MPMMHHTSPSTILSQRITARGVDLSVSAVYHLLFEGLTSGLQAIASASIVQKLLMPQLMAYYLRAWILQWPSWQMPGVMVESAIGYNMWSCLLCIQGNLNATATLGRYCLSFKQLHILYFSRLCWTKGGKDCTNLLWRMIGMTASLASSFARHFTHQACLGYGWLSKNLFIMVLQQPFLTLVDSYTNCVEGNSAETYLMHFDSMRQPLEALTAAPEGFTPYWNLMVRDHVHFFNFSHMYPSWCWIFINSGEYYI